MAVNTSKKTNNVKVVEDVIPDKVSIETTVAKSLNMEEKITLKNLANWMVGFNKIETNGEVNINAGGSARISRAEVISQFENGNKLLCGSGDGAHATIYIDDKPTRDYLEITSELIDKNKVKKIFAIENLDDFKNEINKTFTTQSEKILLIKIIRECRFNDFNKIRECENLCGMTV